MSKQKINFISLIIFIIIIIIVIAVIITVLGIENKKNKKQKLHTVVKQDEVSFLVRMVILQRTAVGGVSFFMYLSKNRLISFL